VAGTVAGLSLCIPYGRDAVLHPVQPGRRCVTKGTGVPGDGRHAGPGEPSVPERSPGSRHGRPFLVNSAFWLCPGRVKHYPYATARTTSTGRHLYPTASPEECFPAKTPAPHPPGGLPSAVANKPSSLRSRHSGKKLPKSGTHHEFQNEFIMLNHYKTYKADMRPRCKVHSDLRVRLSEERSICQKHGPQQQMLIRYPQFEATTWQREC